MLAWSLVAARADGAGCCCCPSPPLCRTDPQTLRDAVERMVEVGLLRRVPDPKYVHPASEHAREEAKRRAGEGEGAEGARGEGAGGAGKKEE